MSARATSYLHTLIPFSTRIFTTPSATLSTFERARAPWGLWLRLLHLLSRPICLHDYGFLPYGLRLDFLGINLSRSLPRYFNLRGRSAIAMSRSCSLSSSSIFRVASTLVISRLIVRLETHLKPSPFIVLLISASDIPLILSSKARLRREVFDKTAFWAILRQIPVRLIMYLEEVFDYFRTRY